MATAIPHLRGSRTSCIAGQARSPSSRSPQPVFFDWPFRLPAAEIAEIDAFREKYRPDREAIHNQQVESINAMLRDDQRAKYAAWRAERERQRKMRDQQHKKQ